MLGVTWCWTSIPSRWSSNTLSQLHATENGISSGSVTEHHSLYKGVFFLSFIVMFCFSRSKHVSRLVWILRCPVGSLLLCFTLLRSWAVLVCCPWVMYSFHSQISGNKWILYLINQTWGRTGRILPEVFLVRTEWSARSVQERQRAIFSQYGPELVREHFTLLHSTFYFSTACELHEFLEFVYKCGWASDAKNQAHSGHRLVFVVGILVWYVVFLLFHMCTCYYLYCCDCYIPCTYSMSQSGFVASSFL